MRSCKNLIGLQSCVMGLGFLLLFLPSALSALDGTYECRNNNSNKSRIFKVEIKPDKISIYTLYNDVYYRLCTSADSIPDERGLICMHGTPGKGSRIATLFTIPMTEIIDFLVDESQQEMVSAEWNQMSKSECVGLFD